MKTLGYIYHITNQINNKKYIGKTFDLNHRLSEHFSNLKHNKHHSHKLQRAVNKYGIENFKVTYNIYEIDKLEDLGLLEIQEIQKYNSQENGYNETRGGEGNKQIFTFEESVLLYQILQRYDGVNRLIAKYYNCDHTVIGNLKNNILYNNIEYDNNELIKLINNLQLTDENLKENYVAHNLKKLDEEKCLEILSVITQKSGYDNTLCEIFNINSKIIYRLKKKEIYKDYIILFEKLNEDKKIKILENTMQKYKIEEKRSQRSRNGVKNPLTQEQINYILDNKDCKTRKQIGIDLNISSDRVSSVITGKSYKNLVKNYYSSIK